ncbi:metal-dependent transcriptional regulator [Holzapfeliella sp. JNUCC 80]
MNLSANKENYLKTIFDLSYDRKKITNKNIADVLQVSAPSVTEMMRSLQNDGLVTHTPYNQIALTESGQKLATKMVRRHRIWESFLSQKLGYGIEELHDAADTLEHATDDLLISRLNQFLGEPERCPHGGIIPDNSPLAFDEDEKILREVEENTTVTITRVIDNHDFLMYFDSLNLKIGDKLTILGHQPFDGTINVSDTHGRFLNISPKSADYIFVKIND